MTLKMKIISVFCAILFLISGFEMISLMKDERRAVILAFSTGMVALTGVMVYPAVMMPLVFYLMFGLAFGSVYAFEVPSYIWVPILVSFFYLMCAMMIKLGFKRTPGIFLILIGILTLPLGILGIIAGSLML